MATDEERLVVSLEARITQFEKAFAKASGTADTHWNKIEARSKEGSKKLASHMVEATSGVTEKMADMAKEAGGVLVAAMGVEKLKDMADKWTAISNKLTVAGVAAGDLKEKMAALSDIAVKTHQATATVASTYTNLSRNAKEIGASDKEVTAVTETLAKMAYNAGMGAEGLAHLGELFNKIFAEGSVEGREMKAIIGEFPGLAKALAREMATAGGSVTKLMADLEAPGFRISAMKLFEALEHSGAQIDETFKKTKPTIDDALQSLSTGLMRYVGEADEATSITDTLAEGIGTLAKNIDIVVPAAVLLGLSLGRAFFTPLNVISSAALAVAAFGDKIHPISGSLLTLADLARTAFTLIKDTGGAALEAMVEDLNQVAKLLNDVFSGVGDPMQNFLAAVKALANGTITAFVGTVAGVKEAWGGLGPALADMTLSTMNKIIGNVEWMANKVIEAVNAISDQTKRFTGVDLGHASTVDLGRIKNGFAGAGKAAGDAFAQGFQSAKKDYVGDALKSAEAGVKTFEKKIEADKAKSEAKTEGNAGASTSATDDVKHTDTAGDIKRAQAMQELIDKSKQFIHAQEIEQKALLLDAQAAATLKKEQELLNEATAKGVKLTADQAAIVHKLAEADAKAELSTKRLTEMKDGIKDLSESISGTLTDAFGKLLNRTGKVRDVMRELLLTFSKMALEGMLLGKGPLAGVLGLKEQGGVLNLNALDRSIFGALFPQLNAKNNKVQPQQVLTKAMQDNAINNTSTSSAPTASLGPATSAVQSIAPSATGDAKSTGTSATAAPLMTMAPALSASTPLAASKAVEEATTKAVQSIAPKVADTATKAVENVGKQISLTPKEITDLKKTLLTEWNPGQGEDQGKGIIDTILNRKASGKWGDSVTDVVNAKKQFSAINGGIPFNGRVAHGVDDIPDSVLNSSKGRQASALTDEWLKARASGEKSVVGDNLNYADRAHSSPKNYAWIDKLKGPKFGVHQHGTTDDLQASRPGEFAVKLPGDDTATNAARQAADAGKKLAEHTKQTADATKDIAASTNTLTKAGNTNNPLGIPGGADGAGLLTGLMASGGALAAEKLTKHEDQYHSVLNAKSDGDAMAALGITAGPNGGHTITFGGPDNPNSDKNHILAMLPAMLGLLKFGSGLGSGLGGDAGAGLFSSLGFADGGHVDGPGTATSDSIPAMLSHGEFVVNAASTAKHGKLLEAINTGKVSKFADGGIVGGGLVGALADVAQAAVNQNSPSNVQNNQRTVNQTVHLQAKDADGVRRSANQVAAELSRATAQAAARWR